MTVAPARSRTNGSPRPVRRADAMPPHDLGIEAAVVSAGLLDGRRLAEAREHVTAADFFAAPHRHVFGVLCDLSDRGSSLDVRLVAAELDRTGRLAEVGGYPALAELIDATPAIANVADHSRIIARHARKRRKLDAAQRLVAGIRTGDDEMEARAEADLQAARGRDDSAPLAVASIFAALDPIQYLVEPLDLCPGAPALVAGYGYSGKTLAAQSMGLAVAAGERVWDCFSATQGRVLHLDYEQGARLTRERYQRLALGMSVGPSDLGDRLALVSMPRTYLDGMSEDALVAMLCGFELVILDSLRAACPTIDENDSAVRRVLDLLTRASERTGCVVVVIHHARKPQREAAGGAKMAIRGSGAIFDACGSVLVFDGEKGQPTRVSHEKARVSGRLVDDFTLTISDAEIGSDPRAGVVVAAEAAPSRQDAADDARAARQRERTERLAEKLRDLFRRDNDQGGADSIAAKVGHNAADIRRALRILVDARQVEELGKTRDRRHRWIGQ